MCYSTPETLRSIRRRCLQRPLYMPIDTLPLSVPLSQNPRVPHTVFLQHLDPANAQLSQGRTQKRHKPKNPKPTTQTMSRQASVTLIHTKGSRINRRRG